MGFKCFLLGINRTDDSFIGNVERVYIFNPARKIPLIELKEHNIIIKNFFNIEIIHQEFRLAVIIYFLASETNKVLNIINLMIRIM